MTETIVNAEKLIQRLIIFQCSKYYGTPTSLCQRLDSIIDPNTSAGGARKIEREARARAPKARESPGGERRAQRAFRRRRKRFREAGVQLLT